MTDSQVTILGGSHSQPEILLPGTLQAMEAGTKKTSRHRPRPDLSLKVLDAAEPLFAERSYEEVTIDEIAALAGVAKGVVYYYFDSKKGLFVAVVQRVVDDLVKQISATKREDSRLSPQLVIAATLDDVFDLADQYNDLRAFTNGGIGAFHEMVPIWNSAEIAMTEILLDRVGEYTVRNGLPEPPRTLARKYAVRGWINFVVSLVSTWHADRDIDRDVIREIGVRTFLDSLAAADAADAAKN
ncbi:MAG: TetR/AcrR family transcriptional regulator [Thermoleophilaceae bacterium]|nr:TetR/AcrR family transcriptional regulator [Thermoleophilaceae bacterium]